MKNYIGINPLDIEGATFTFGKGYGFGTSRFVHLSINGKKYTPLLSAKANTFGIKEWKDRVKENAFCKIKEGKDNLTFYAKSGNVKINNPFIVGIPMVHLGNPIWGPNTGFELGKIKDYKSIKVSTKFDFKAIKGHSNFVLDLFLTKKRNDHLDLKTDAEIEIWFATSFPPPGDKIAETKDFEVFYRKKISETQHWFNVVTKKNTIEMMDIIKIMKTKIKYVEELNLHSFDFGPEFSINSEVKTKLYKMDLALIKK